ncbi:MAG: hypothetical protein IIB16_10455 [Chloroflexi bacterium]|nr:hypothetical protein [Chloroflexota bacterium]
MHNRWQWTHHETVAEQLDLRNEVINRILPFEVSPGPPPRMDVFGITTNDLVLRNAFRDRTVQAEKPTSAGADHIAHRMVLVRRAPPGVDFCGHPVGAETRT